jgi:hypothetical protein
MRANSALVVGAAVAEDAPMRSGAAIVLGALGAMLLVGCGSADDASTETTGADDEELVTGGGDDGQALAAANPTATQVVYVNFDGPTVTDCANYCSDARTNKSWIMGYLGRKKVDFAPYTSARGKSTIMAALRAHFAAYDVSFTEKRPTSGDYEMVIISPTVLPHHGIAPLDCGNTNKDDIAFVFKTNEGAGDSPEREALIGREASHELGHSFGLTHVDNDADIMQWASSGSRFTIAKRDRVHDAGKCMSGEIQNAPAMLKKVLGAHR